MLIVKNLKKTYKTKGGVEVKALIQKHVDLGHRIGILGCSTAEMKENVFNHYIQDK